MPVGADSTVPSIENDLDIEAWIENTAQDIKPLPLLPNENNGGFDTPNSSMVSNSSSHSINNHTLTNTQPYISSISSLIKGSRMTIVEPRDSFQTNLSPILRGAITGTYPLTSYPQIKFESVEMMKPEYYQEQMPHSTTIPGDIHRRLNAQDMLRSKPKPPKIRQVRKILRVRKKKLEPFQYFFSFSKLLDFFIEVLYKYYISLSYFLFPNFLLIPLSFNF